MNIKVQIINHCSVKSLLESGLNQEDLETNPLTFHVFSDTMKARMMEQFLTYKLKIGISICNEKPKTGEWHESINPNNIWNK